MLRYGFYYAFADYEEHNSETFDPCDKVFGNYGIDSIRNTIHKILEEYHYFKIAASQVDIIAHSMGGGNYMNGSIDGFHMMTLQAAVQQPQ